MSSGRVKYFNSAYRRDFGPSSIGGLAKSAERDTSSVHIKDLYALSD